MESNDWLLGEIAKRTGKSTTEIEAMIKKKLEEFPALTADAAKRMVATENGVTPIRRDYSISDINEEINHINVNGRIRKKFKTREINLKGTKSKIINFILGDETGLINVVVWDVKKVKELDEEASEGDEISIANGYSKTNRMNDKIELNLGSGSAIKITKSVRAAKKEDTTKIEDIGDEIRLYKVVGFITRLFSNNTFIVKCNICKSRVVEKCDVHGDKAISKTLLINGVLDDGLSSIRVAFFDKTAEKLLNFSNAATLEDKIREVSYGLLHIEVDAVTNKFNDSLSLTCRDVRPVDYSL